MSCSNFTINILSPFALFLVYLSSCVPLPPLFCSYRIIKLKMRANHIYSMTSTPDLLVFNQQISFRLIRFEKETERFVNSLFFKCSTSSS